MEKNDFLELTELHDEPVQPPLSLLTFYVHFHSFTTPLQGQPGNKGGDFRERFSPVYRKHPLSLFLFFPHSHLHREGGTWCPGEHFPPGFQLWQLSHFHSNQDHDTKRRRWRQNEQAKQTISLETKTHLFFPLRTYKSYKLQNKEKQSSLSWKAELSTDASCKSIKADVENSLWDKAQSIPKVMATLYLSQQSKSFSKRRVNYY